MRRLTVLGAVASGAVAIHAASLVTTAVPDPFEFLQPTVVVTADDRTRLDRDEVLVRVLPADGGEVGVFAATRLDAPADALVAWTGAIAELKRSPYVLAIGRFSEPPVPGDLDALSLDADDLDAIRRCRPGACDIKLTAAEIQVLRVAIAQAGGDWHSTVQREFRRLVLARLEAYRTGGLAALAPYADRDDAIGSLKAFDDILESSVYLRERLPAVVSRLERYPRADAPVVDSFFYWSKEQYGAGKPVVAVTHVEIMRPDSPSAPQVISLSKELFATHYRNASLGLSAVVGPDDGVRYLVYVNRSQTDVLGGVFGGLKRKLIEGRLRSETAAMVAMTRRRLESGRAMLMPIPP